MKKIALSLALISVLFSCKKSSSGSSSGYHVTATIDGTAKTFNTSPLATKVTNTGFVLMGIEGFTTQNGETLAIGITNSPSGKTIVAGTYTDTDPDFAITLNYIPNTSTAYVGGNSAAAGGTPVTNHVKVVITSMDATTIKGTFSGDVFLNGDPSAAKKTITNGDFYAKFQ